MEIINDPDVRECLAFLAQKEGTMPLI